MHCTLLTVANTDNLCRIYHRNELAISVNSVKCVHKVENIRVSFIKPREENSFISMGRY